MTDMVDPQVQGRASIACGKFVASNSVEHAEEAIEALKVFVAEFEEDFS